MSLRVLGMWYMHPYFYRPIRTMWVMWSILGRPSSLSRELFLVLCLLILTLETNIFDTPGISIDAPSLPYPHS